MSQPFENLPATSGSDESRFTALLIQIWREVFQRDHIGIQDNFFALGGTSLLGTRIITRLCQATGVEFTLRMLLDAPTIAEFAMVIDHLDKLPPYQPISPRPRKRQKAVVLSLQKGTSDMAGNGKNNQELFYSR